MNYGIRTALGILLTSFLLGSCEDPSEPVPPTLYTGWQGSLLFTNDGNSDRTEWIGFEESQSFRYMTEPLLGMVLNGTFTYNETNQELSLRFTDETGVLSLTDLSDNPVFVTDSVMDLLFSATNFSYSNVSYSSTILAGGDLDAPFTMKRIPRFPRIASEMNATQVMVNASFLLWMGETLQDKIVIVSALEGSSANSIPLDGFPDLTEISKGLSWDRISGKAAQPIIYLPHDQLPNTNNTITLFGMVIDPEVSQSDPTEAILAMGLGTPFTVTKGTDTSTNMVLWLDPASFMEQN